ncbi:MAG: type II toxin-antitoxin system ParD family antitoxin [Planctomycetota bacterium]|nr:type II toxin-antitoxin system ParD family antitoxin [Planctomycetota bacterium]
MTTVSVNLSEELQQFVNGQAEAGRFDGPAGYIESLIERAKSGQEKLEALLIEGLDSGDPIRLDADEWSHLRRDVEQRLSNG